MPKNLAESRNKPGRLRFRLCFSVLLFAAVASAQQKAAAPHVIGTVTSVDAAQQSVKLKQDRTGTEYTAELGGTKTILSVPPGTKPADLRKMARRIAPDQIHPGDRIEVYYSAAPAGGNTIEARAAVVMSASSLQAAHSAEAEAWQHSTPGVVASIDPSAHTLTLKIRTAGGTQPVTLTTTPATQFTRYSAENPKMPAPAQFGDLQPGDVIRVIGERNADGSSIAAQRVYVAPRQIPAVVASISAADNTLTVKDLRNKRKITIAVNSQTQVRKLPPQVAQMLAHRLNPAYRAREGGGEEPQIRAEQGSEAAPHRYGEAGANGSRGGASHSAADLSSIIERAPEISLGDLKPGDAVVISGGPVAGGAAQLLANTIVAGVEPIFQSAPPQRGESLGNWSLGTSAPPEE